MKRVSAAFESLRLSVVETAGITAAEAEQMHLEAISSANAATDGAMLFTDDFDRAKPLAQWPVRH